MKTFAEVVAELNQEAEEKKMVARNVTIPCRKIEYQNAGALIKQEFEPMLKLVTDYEAGANPGDWRKNEKLVNLFGYGTTLEAVILFITRNYASKGPDLKGPNKRGKAKTEKIDNG